MQFPSASCNFTPLVPHFPHHFAHKHFEFVLSTVAETTLPIHINQVYAFMF
jgi:hypothetical protein